MATKCDEELDLIKFSKGEAEVWSYFKVKQHKISKKVIDNVTVYLKCGVEVRCPGWTTNLASHVCHDHPQFLGKTQSGAEQ